jgi:hypothetical protein
MGLPERLDAAWCRWITGEWEGPAEGAVGRGRHRMKVEPALGGQFLLTTYRSTIDEMTDDHVRFAKDKLGLSDADLERVRGGTFEELGLQTLDPSTGDIVAYVFDSWRSMLTGTGRREGDREVITFTGPDAAARRVLEKVGDDRLVMTQEWTLPDGTVMVEKGEMTRVGGAG